MKKYARIHYNGDDFLAELSCGIVIRAYGPLKEWDKLTSELAQELLNNQDQDDAIADGSLVSYWLTFNKAFVVDYLEEGTEASK